MAGYAHPHRLMETAELATRLDDGGLAVIEVDEDTTAYEKGHIPGAVALDWQQELHALPRRDFVSAEQLAALLGARGVGTDQTVVLFGDNNNWFAAYAYWVARMYGIANVILINGGRKKWELESRPLDTDRPARPGTYSGPAQPRPELRTSATTWSRRARHGSWWTCAHRLSTHGELLAPAHLPQDGRTSPGTSRRPQHPLVEGGQRGRDVQVGRRTPCSSTRARASRRHGDRHLLPDRGAVVAHLVRARRTAGLPQRAQLRRLVDRIRQPGRRARRARLRTPKRRPPVAIHVRS